MPCCGDRLGCTNGIWVGRRLAIAAASFASFLPPRPCTRYAHKLCLNYSRVQPLAAACWYKSERPNSPPWHKAAGGKVDTPFSITCRAPMRGSRLRFPLNRLRALEAHALQGQAYAAIVFMNLLLLLRAIAAASWCISPAAGRGGLRIIAYRAALPREMRRDL